MYGGQQLVCMYNCGTIPPVFHFNVSAITHPRLDVPANFGINQNWWNSMKYSTGSANRDYYRRMQDQTIQLINKFGCCRIGYVLVCCREKYLNFNLINSFLHILDIWLDRLSVSKNLTDYQIDSVTLLVKF